MTGDSLASLGQVIDFIGHELRPHDCGRFDVIRTKHTEDRAPIDRETRRLVYKRDHYRCVWCGSRDRLQLDHVVPWSAGGSEDIDNLRTLCAQCNSRRSNFGRAADLLINHLPHGFACVTCWPEMAIGNDGVEPIFCVSCEHHSAGFAAHPGFSAYFRNIGLEIASEPFSHASPVTHSATTGKRAGDGE